MKPRRLAVGALGIIALLCAIMFIFLNRIGPVQTSGLNTTRTISIDGVAVRVAVVDTPESRTRGLSGVERLGPNEGMLFLFDADGWHSFWMKDMKIPIDILWISAEKQVIWIAANIDPSSYPEAFAPRDPARYVLEVPAGFAHANGISPGSRVDL